MIRSRDLKELWRNVCEALDWLDLDMAEMYLENGSGLKEENRQDKWAWTRGGFDRHNDLCKECLLKLELPLLATGNKCYGTLWLLKDLKRDPVSHYTLRRIEQLRRTVMETLQKFMEN